MEISKVIAIVAVMNLLCIIVIVILSKTMKREVPPPPPTPASVLHNVATALATTVESFNTTAPTAWDPSILKSIDNVQPVIDMFIPKNLRSNCIPTPKSDANKILNYQWNYVDCMNKKPDILDKNIAYYTASLTLIFTAIRFALTGSKLNITRNSTGIVSTDPRIKTLFDPFIKNPQVYASITPEQLEFINSNRETVLKFISDGTTLSREDILLITSTNYNQRITPELAISNWNTTGITIPYDMLVILLIGQYVDFSNRLKGGAFKRCELISYS
jgi:hypothetical protein